MKIKKKYSYIQETKVVSIHIPIVSTEPFWEGWATETWFELVKTIRDTGETSIVVYCNHAFQVDGVSTTMIMDKDGEEEEEVRVDLSETPTGKYLLSEIKDWKI